MKKLLTIVMPAYNEEKLIYDNLMTVIEETARYTDSFDIIVVNDGSRDDTKKEILRAKETDPRIHMISYKENRGKGYAVKRGVLRSDAKYTAFIDSDLELPAYQLEGYIKKIEEEDADIVIGSKMHKDSKIEYSLFRKLMSVVFYIMVKVLFRLDVKDTQTGIKLFRTESIKPVFEKAVIRHFSFDIEILAIAGHMGLKIVEMPVVLHREKRRERRSKITAKQIIIMIVDTFYTFFRLKKI